MDSTLSEVIRLRCDPKFRAAVYAAAQARGLTVSELVRAQLAAAVEIPRPSHDGRFSGVPTTARDMTRKGR